MITLEGRSIREIGPLLLIVGGLQVSTFGPRHEEMQPGPAPRPMVEPSLGPPRIVIVDDDPSIRSAARALLEDRGFAVVGEAEDGLQATEVVAELLPDVVLMDVKMPVMDGLEATRRIRASHPSVQVIVFSAYDDPSFRQTAAEIGATGYLVKGASLLAAEQALRDATEVSRGLRTHHHKEP